MTRTTHNSQIHQNVDNNENPCFCAYKIYSNQNISTIHNMSYAGYSCNDNQNYFVQNGRTTSRVLQEPGGRTSIDLGWGSPKPAKKNQSLSKLSL